MKNNYLPLPFICVFIGILFMGCGASNKITIVKPLKSDVPPRNVIVKVEQCRPRSVIVGAQADFATILDIQRFEASLHDGLTKRLRQNGFSTAEREEDADLVIEAKLIRFQPMHWVVKSYVQKKEGEIVSQSYAGRGEWEAEIEYLDKSRHAVGLIHVKPRTARNLSPADAASDVANQVADYSATIKNR